MGKGTRTRSPPHSGMGLGYTGPPSLPADQQLSGAVGAQAITEGNESARIVAARDGDEFAFARLRRIRVQGLANCEPEQEEHAGRKDTDRRVVFHSHGRTTIPLSLNGCSGTIAAAAQTRARGLLTTIGSV